MGQLGTVVPRKETAVSFIDFEERSQLQAPLPV
jgi:hypothetical protein